MADQPIAALIKDLKQRGLLDETLVVWGSEFGRTPLGENRAGDNSNITGRDHHPYPPADLHATMLHLFGLDHLQLTYRYQGRDFRLTDVAGNVIHSLIA
jgi:hypothetical protein